MKPLETIREFDRFLQARGLKLEAIVIGGAALNLLGVISRETRDCDVLYPTLEADIVGAAREFAATREEHLQPDWLNDKPSSLTRDLPAGWTNRLQTLFRGDAIVLHTLGRLDLLRSKVFALCDRGIDIHDCVAMAPTTEELYEIMPWLEAQDGNPGWPDHVRETIGDLRRRLGHAV